MKHWQCLGAAALAWAGLSASALAQIIVGQTVGVTGAVAATVKEAGQGARLYIDSVNAQGGIKGEKIEIVTLDDKFDVKLTVANARTLIEEKNAVVLFMDRGRILEDRDTHSFFTEPHTARARDFLSKILQHDMAQA